VRGKERGRSLLLREGRAERRAADGAADLTRGSDIWPRFSSKASEGGVITHWRLQRLPGGRARSAGRLRRASGSFGLVLFSVWWFSWFLLPPLRFYFEGGEDFREWVAALDAGPGRHWRQGVRQSWLRGLPEPGRSVAYLTTAAPERAESFVRVQSRRGQRTPVSRRVARGGEFSKHRHLFVTQRGP